jgi:hypothetical protein
MKFFFSSERTLGFPGLDHGSTSGGNRDNAANSHCLAAVASGIARKGIAAVSLGRLGSEAAFPERELLFP